jgi:hypothetical protein
MFLTLLGIGLSILILERNIVKIAVLESKKSGITVFFLENCMI